MRYLTLQEVFVLHRRLVEQSGGTAGIRSLPLLESAVAQPHMTFAGELLYPSLIEQAAVLGFVLIMNHPFIDGNKRTGQAALEVFLILNGHEIIASVDEQEAVILHLAAGELSLEGFTDWLRLHVVVMS